jgi:pseudaminic acid biosynthesis-associated methylase
VTLDTEQLRLWAGDFGYDYSTRGGNVLAEEDLARLRRNWGVMLGRALAPAPRSALEVGANIGRNLIALRGMIPELHAVEPNARCCEHMTANPALDAVTVHCASAFALPFPDRSVDLAFTSGVLIHIAPDDLGAATDEIVRVARHYVLAIEYFARKPESVAYRGLGEGFLFKRDFGSWYLDRYPMLRVVDYGFLWSRVDAGDDLTWWLFARSG